MAFGSLDVNALIRAWMFPIIFSKIQWQQWKVTKPSKPMMTMIRLEALITNLTQKGLKECQKLWPTRTDCEESSEYKECREGLSESDLEG